MGSSEDGKLIVVAIDFGTAYSGYAYSMRASYKIDPMKIEVNGWEGEGVEKLSFKAPSCILLNPDQSFHSFGYKAEDKFAELAEEEKHHDWFFLSQFKMKLLYKEDIERDALLETDDGKTVSGSKILTMTFDFMRNHFMKTQERKGTGVRMEDVLWVITVPAIWSEAAKQFTREATEKIGIDSSSLIFSYEPEAAALYSRKLPLHDQKNDESSAFSFKRGKTIMVVDVGGGTADISVLEAIDDNTINIVEKASGGPWGGVTINALFKRFLTEFWGEEIIAVVKKECYSDYLILQRAFENKKRSLNPDDSKPLCLRLSRSFKKICERETTVKFKDFPVRKEFCNHVSLGPYDMKINSDFAFQRFFEPIIANITETCRNIQQKQIKREIDSVVVVGGLSQCQLLVKSIRNAFEPVPVSVPTDAGLAVLKGAVLYGHDRNVIKARVCKYTYGVRIMRKFDKDHDTQKLVHQEGEKWAKDCFKIFYEAGESIKLGDTKSYKLKDTFRDNDRTSRKNKPIACDLFYSSDSQPKYVTDKTCGLLGHLYIDPPSDGFEEKWEGTVEMEFAGTEIIGRIKDGNDTSTVRFDFLT